MGDLFGFGEALSHLKGGGRVTRFGWNGTGMYLFLVNPWDICELREDVVLSNIPFIAMRTTDDKAVPWEVSQIDLLATDWTSC